MPLVLLLVLLLVVVMVAMAITFSIIHLVWMLLIAGLVGYLADVIVPGRLPWGWLGTILAGLVGSWIGIALFNLLHLPRWLELIRLGGIPLIPALVGAIIIAFVANALAKSTVRTGRT